jgi:dihydroorotate dehydrogenase electron transfer subunit
MVRGQGIVAELVLSDGGPAARIACGMALIPRPGQYVMAHDGSPDAPIAAQLFAARSVADGFVAAPPLPVGWQPGTRIQMRGPLGRGFLAPREARRIALLALDGQPALLLALLERLRNEAAAEALVCDDAPRDLPAQLEVHPLTALRDVCAWSDYAACEIEREAIPRLTEYVVQDGKLIAAGAAQVLIRTPMPCGGMAECGVCTIPTSSGAQLACVSGPVFDLGSLIGKG